MIQKRTVFVLGAGASLPYGFPVGRTLKKIVLQTIEGGGWAEHLGINDWLIRIARAGRNQTLRHKVSFREYGGFSGRH